MQNAAKYPSVLLKYLPAIYQDPGWGEEDSTGPVFLNGFLSAFEKILLGRNDGVEPTAGSLVFLGDTAPGFQGLEEKIANLPFLFDAARTPGPFLEWLAGWSALTLSIELSERSRRELIAEIIPLYRIRGTKSYLQRLLSLFLGGGATVDDQASPGIQIGRYSTLAADTYLGGSEPHYFRVKLSVSPGEESRHEARRRLACEVIDRAKPAHTYYNLEIIAPRFQIGIRSRVGVDTFLV